MAKNYVVKKGNIYWPSDEMKKIAWVSEKVYAEADKNPIKFWANLAKEGITWTKKWDKDYDRCSGEGNFRRKIRGSNFIG